MQELLDHLQTMASDFPSATAFAEAIATELHKDDRWGPESVANAMHHFERIAAIMKDPSK